MLRFLFVLVLLAVAIYLLVRVFQERGMMPDRPSRPQRPRSTPLPPVAPDDDEDFLRDLDRKRLNPEDPDA